MASLFTGSGFKKASLKQERVILSKYFRPINLYIRSQVKRCLQLTAFLQ